MIDKKLIIILVAVALYFAFSFIKGAIVKNKLNNEEDNNEHVLLDVRTIEETKDGMLENAINIPLAELDKKLDMLDKNKEIWVYCRSGNRASTAVGILTKNGFKAKNIGGYEDLKSK